MTDISSPSPSSQPAAASSAEAPSTAATGSAAPNLSTNAPSTAGEASNEGSSESVPWLSKIKDRFVEKDGKLHIKYLIDGKEELAEFDQEHRQRQIDKAGAKRIEEGARLKREAEETLARVKEELIEAFTSPAKMRSLALQMGVNPKSLADQILDHEYEEAQLSPAERELRQIKMQQQQLEQQQAWEQQQWQQQQESQTRESIDRGINQALAESPSLSLDDFQMDYVRAYSDSVFRHIQNGQRPAKLPDGRAVTYKMIAAEAIASLPKVPLQPSEDDILQQLEKDEQLRRRAFEKFLPQKPATPNLQTVERPRDASGRFIQNERAPSAPAKRTYSDGGLARLFRQ